jgi:hypothetical protein
MGYDMVDGQHTSRDPVQKMSEMSIEGSQKWQTTICKYGKCDSYFCISPVRTKKAH